MNSEESEANVELEVPAVQVAPTKPAELTLTDEQQEAVERVLNFLGLGLTADEFKLGGYAGTGKTTVIKSLIKTLREKKDKRSVVSAFTGKACNVLQKKGVPAQTLHSLMYDVTEDPKTHQVQFIKREVMNGAPDFVIVDEASMVSSELYKDLKSFDVPVLFVGDPGQLEPVGDNPNLMKEPDFVLSKIHRQAAESPIIRLANNIRQGGSLGFNGTQGGLTIRGKGVNPVDFLSVDQVICAKNKTRQGFNSQIREYKQLKEDLTQGEKIIVLRNNRFYGVFNGMLLWVEQIKADGFDYWLCDCKDEVGQTHYDLKLWKVPFTDKFFDPKDALERIPRDRVYFDYGYAITCHKSQGSEWPSVLIYDEWLPPQVWDMKRWRYTAITRAAEKLVFCK